MERAVAREDGTVVAAHMAEKICNTMAVGKWSAAPGIDAALGHHGRSVSGETPTRPEDDPHPSSGETGYDAMGSYPLAMEFQKRVVDSWRNHGADARDELKEAMRLYNQIKAKALACLSPEGSANALPEPREQETDSDTAKAVQR